MVGLLGEHRVALGGGVWGEGGVRGGASRHELHSSCCTSGAGMKKIARHHARHSHSVQVGGTRNTLHTRHPAPSTPHPALKMRKRGEKGKRLQPGMNTLRISIFEIRCKQCNIKIKSILYL